MQEIEHEDILNVDISIEDVQKSNRIMYLDIARVIAIILVVFCHAIENVYKMNLQEWNILTMQSRIFMTASFIISRLGVPLFLFISGKLLLSKKIENTDDCIKFYKKNLIPLIVTVEIWNVIYNIFISVFNSQEFDIKELLLNIFFLKKVDLQHMWYMPMIIGMYIAIPFLSIIVKKVNIKALKIPMILVFIAIFIIPSVNRVVKVLYNEQYNFIVDLSFFGGMYGLYIILGYYIGNNLLKRVSSLLLVLIGTIAFILSCNYQMWLYNHNNVYNLWYDFAGILITSACMFEILSRIKIKFKDKIEKFLTYMSKISLGIFFLHIIIIKILTRYIDFNVINKPISTIILTLVTVIISTVLISILSRMKIIRKRVFLIK